MRSSAALIRLVPKYPKRHGPVSKRKILELFMEDMRVNPSPRRKHKRDSNASVLCELTQEAILYSGEPYLTIEEARAAVTHALGKRNYRFNLDYWYYVNLLAHASEFVVTAGNVFLA